jgi:YesN/AraC family two-component response regulator
MLKIIFVDDEVDLLPLFKMRLVKELGDFPNEVITADSGQACIDILKSLDLSEKILVITDINMPRMNGFGLMKILKSDFPAVQYYVCTAYDTPEFEKRSQESGAMRFFTKPLEYLRLRNAIKKDFAPEKTISS